MKTPKEDADRLIKKALEIGQLGDGLTYAQIFSIAILVCDELIKVVPYSDRVGENHEGKKSILEWIYPRETVAHWKAVKEEIQKK